MPALIDIRRRIRKIVIFETQGVSGDLHSIHDRIDLFYLFGSQPQLTPDSLTFQRDHGSHESEDTDRARPRLFLILSRSRPVEQEDRGQCDQSDFQ